MNSIAIVSGYFNPLHDGHVEYINAAAKYGSLVVIVNNDEQVRLKGGTPVINEQARCFIISNLKSVDSVVLSVDTDGAVSKSIECVAKTFPDTKMYFINSGDRPPATYPESEAKVCEAYDIEMIYVTLPKRNNSSEMRDKLEREMRKKR